MHRTAKFRPICSSRWRAAPFRMCRASSELEPVESWTAVYPERRCACVWASGVRGADVRASGVCVCATVPRMRVIAIISKYHQGDFAQSASPSKDSNRQLLYTPGRYGFSYWARLWAMPRSLCHGWMLEGTQALFECPRIFSRSSA